MGILQIQQIKKMKLFAAVLALVNANALDERLAVISSHVDRLAAGSLDLDNAKDARYVSKLNFWMDFISTAIGDRDGAECDFQEADDEGADVQVFSPDDYCKLNGQIMSALSSAARKWACEGRGRPYRQAVRRLRKVKKQFDRNHCF